ncbi:MAG: DUF2946 family protein [Gammaproteobacteria bacterium]|nr:DUF2946 family protein [Gammaproteobacteria bacterium]MCP5423964.1 DUF2946 family protein [Gammaproteobacteria bacterium]MCP5459443.1 DUF2946 family protein [Gammaproteobacteria bacterium]
MRSTAAPNPFVRTRPLRRGAWLGLWALLLQTLIPFSQAIPVPWQSPTGMLLVCQTYGGVKSVPLTLGSERGKQKAPAPNPFQCPICQLQATGGNSLPVLPGLAVLPLPIYNLERIVARPADGTFSTHRHKPAQPRAPPFLLG